MLNTSATIKAPSVMLMLMEGRAAWELGAYVASAPLFKRMPEGDGHPVLVLPGLAGSDVSTAPLRKFLQKRNYQPFAWELGRNLGLRDGLLEGMLARIDDIFEQQGEKISLIGWSLGGVYARELAKMRPEKVRMVITLGSPHSGDVKATHARRLYEFVAGHAADNPPIEATLTEAPPVPSTSIYSRTDGVVAWQNCVQEMSDEKVKVAETENVRVEGSHCGLGVNPSVLFVIADRLSQAEGSWTPFEVSGLRKPFFSASSYIGSE